jgi:tellurite resistance protein
MLRDLCVIARADGHVSDAEMAVIRDIAVRVEVALELVSCVLDPTLSGCGS